MVFDDFPKRERVMQLRAADQRHNLFCMLHSSLLSTVTGGNLRIKGFRSPAPPLVQFMQVQQRLAVSVKPQRYIASAK